MSQPTSHATDPTDLNMSDPMDLDDRMRRVERYGIGYIPDDERASRPLNLGFILFGGSLTFSLFIIGWFPIAFGLGWWMLRAYEDAGIKSDQIYGVTSIIVGVLLLAYEAYFIKKLKNVSYL